MEKQIIIKIIEIKIASSLFKEINRNNHCNQHANSETYNLETATTTTSSSKLILIKI